MAKGNRLAIGFHIGIMVLLVIWLRLTRFAVRDVAGTFWFSNLLLNAIGLVVLCLGYVHGFLLESIGFCLLAWAVTIILHDKVRR